MEANGYADFYSPWLNGERIKVMGVLGFVCLFFVCVFGLFVCFPNKTDGVIKSITLLRFYLVQGCPGQ